jgi:hypothetical protein
MMSSNFHLFGPLKGPKEEDLKPTKKLTFCAKMAGGATTNFFWIGIS